LAALDDWLALKQQSDAVQADASHMLVQKRIATLKLSGDDDDDSDGGDDDDDSGGGDDHATQVTLDRAVNVYDVLPENRQYWTWAGSLTTPPCSEGVTWVLLQQTVTISKDQLEAFPYKNNARPPQPLHERTVYSGSARTSKKADPQQQLDAVSTVARQPVQLSSEEWHWGFDDEHENNGPTKWGAHFPGCNGKEQSPIDIKTSDVVSRPSNTLWLDWKAQSELIVQDTGHTIQVNTPHGGTTTFEGQDYKMLQFHFHRGSENRIDGKQFPLEVHIVHKNEAGRLLVVGVLFADGAENAFLSKLAWDNLPTGVRDAHHAASPRPHPSHCVESVDYMTRR
jgi:carbonic anhydrase